MAPWVIVLSLTGGYGFGCSQSESTQAEAPPAAETVAQTQGATPAEPAPQVDTSAAYASPAALATPAGLNPQFGGVVQALGQYIVEVLSRDDGHLEAQVRDLQGQPVSPQGVEVEAEIQNQPEPVQVVMLPMDDRFVGTIPDVSGLRGQRPVDLVLSLPDAVEPIARTTFEALNLQPVRVRAAPQHHGRVSVVGETRVEVTTTPNRQVYVSVTDLEGNPIPPDMINLNQITLVGPNGPQIVSLQPRGAMFYGTLAAAPPESYTVVFDIGYGPRTYRHVRIRHGRPVPPTVVVAPPPVFDQRDHWRRDWRWDWAPAPSPRVVVTPAAPPPTVIVTPAPPPRVVVTPGAPPPPVIVTPAPPPRVVVQPAPPPRVVVPPPPRRPHGGPPGHTKAPPPGHGGPHPGGGHGRGHR